MKETKVTGIQYTTSEEEVPDGTFAVMGLDMIAMEETGYIHLIEFLLPEESRGWFEMWVERDVDAHLIYDDEGSEEFTLHGIRYNWKRVAVVALTWLLD